MTAQAVEQAMKQHDGLVHTFIQRRGGGDIRYGEAQQAGRIGLWRAVLGYDPARGRERPKADRLPSASRGVAGAGPVAWRPSAIVCISRLS